jgi:UDP-glucose 4-epimerase
MDEYRGKEVLITGGLGFIGSNLAIRLVESGALVTLLDSLHPSCGANRFNVHPIQNEVTVVEGDCCNLELMRGIVRGKSHVFNLAGHVSHSESMLNPFSDLWMNATGPLTVLEACRLENPEVRIIYTSTRQCYGHSAILPLIETQPLNPIDINGVNKMAGERYHAIYTRAHGIPTVSLRLVNTYGPRQLIRHARQGFAGWFVRQAIDGLEIQLYGDGQQLRDLNYIDDVVDALLLAGTKNIAGECFNLGGTAPVTLEQFASILISVAGCGSYRVVPFPSEHRKVDIGSAYSSFEKFHSATGWQPRISLEEGLARTVEYYRRYRHHYL